MATLVTVHGTTDTGPEEGNRWWQRGGPLDEDIRRLVVGEDGPVKVVPHTWHGNNSEAGRYAAAKDLARRLTDLEESGEKYCLVSHSHGGSLIAHALGQLQAKRRNLANMTRWVTVGTPFIHTQRQPFLFSRIRTVGVAALLILIYLFLMWVAFAASAFYLIFVAKKGLQNEVFDILILILAPLFIGALYFLLWRSQPAKLRMIDARSGAERARQFALRWLGLWHSDDEVINGGRVLKDVKFEPFKPNFASPLFAFTSLLLTPVILLFAASADLYPVLSGHIGEWIELKAASDPDWFKAFARDSLAIIELPAIGIFEVLKRIGVEATDNPATNITILSVILIAGAAVGFLIIWMLSIWLHQIVLYSSGVISNFLSKVLNNLTRSQVVALGYGSDSRGEFAVGAYPKPAWIEDGFACLPEQLETDITRSSDEAASSAIVKLRQALSTLDFGETGSGGDVLSRYLTWSELIHTNYFRVPRFRKLVAYIVAQQDGFRPSQEFLNDPEYALMSDWLQQIESSRSSRP